MKDKTPKFLWIVLIFLIFLSWMQRGWDAVWEGIMAGGEILWEVIPLLVAAFLVAGMTQVLVTQDFVTKWLGAETGWKGIGLACFAGALIPGGPYVYYPITAVMLHNGAGIGVLVAFVSAKNLWSVSRLPYEIALIGLDFTIARFLITLIFPPLLGLLSEFLFGRYLDRVRKGAPVL